MKAIIHTFLLFFILTPIMLISQVDSLNKDERAASNYYILNINYSDLLNKKWIKIDSVKINEKSYIVKDSLIAYKIEKKKFDFQSSMFIDIYLNNQKFSVVVTEKDFTYCNELKIEFFVSKQKHLCYYQTNYNGFTLSGSALTQTAFNIYRSLKVKKSSRFFR